MSDYQKALEAARWLASLPRLSDPPPGTVAEKALIVARMFLRNHAIAHGEKPE